MNRHTHIHDNGCREGAAIVTVMVILGVVSLVTVPLMLVARSASRAAARWRDYDQCILCAHSAMEEAKWNIQQRFETYYKTTPLPCSRFKFDWFDTWSSNTIGPTNQPRFSAAQGAVYTNSIGFYSNANVWVTVKGVQAPEGDERDVILSVRSEMNGIVRQITEVVRFQRAPSRIFDYAYFINNFGWFWGNTIDAHGDVRANGNFSFGSYTPLVNGDVYASINEEIGADGSIAGGASFWGIDSYYSAAPSRARPGNPPSTNYPSGWTMGYDGTSENHEYEEILEMPYLGDLSDYEWLANRENGYVSQGTNMLIDKVYAGAGPDGVWSNADDGTLILDGTVTPIKIEGPVVVRGDVIIKGTVTGQGTIYAGRNVHIVGDVIASNPPSWTKPDNNPGATAYTNSTADLVCLAAKGNVILGDYTDSYWNWIKSYMKPNFTNPYETDPTDADIGYDSDGDPSNGCEFNGDYTAHDGGQKLDGTNNVARRYYEASVSDATLHALAQPTKLARVDAVVYNNHLIGGVVGDSSSGITFNGSLVSRDEAIGYNHSVNINWDIRLGMDSDDYTEIDIYLPFTLANPTLVQLKED